MSLTERKKDELEIAAERYIDDLKCLEEIERDELKKRAVNHAVFCNNWKQLEEYIDGKKCEIILYGKMKPEPKAMNYGSYE